MSRTKAVHLKSYKKFVATQGGEVVYLNILSQLSEEDRNVVEGTVHLGQWLDYDLWWRLLTIADRVLGNGDYAIVRQIGAFDAKENLSTIYKVFIAMMSIPAVVRRSSMIWKQYYDSGTINVVSVEAKQAELHLVDFPDLPLHHEEELLGWMGAAIEMTGSKLKKIEHTTCMAKGDPCCTFLLEWDG